MTADEFENQLHLLCATAGPLAARDPDMAAAMLTTLIGSAAFTISMMANGDEKFANKLCEGATQYLFTECSNKAEIGKMAVFLARASRG